MNKKYLFSPVGGTDPISETNCYDGAMLHICRVYQPDEVILYMSKEILHKHNSDNRYIYCLDRLYEKLNKQYSYKIIERPEMVNVQDFNIFYEDFRSILKDISSRMDETDQLLINVSSGTPSMKSGLVVICTFGEVKGTLIQVTTPIRRMNEHRHEGNDPAFLWEANEDNKDDFEDRCYEISCPDLITLKNEELIKSLIRNYDYSGALEIIKTMPQEATSRYVNLVEIARKRLMGDIDTVANLCKKAGVSFMPVTERRKRAYFEYVSGLDIKLKSEQYTDFIRGITPAVAEGFIMIIKELSAVDVRSDCCAQDKFGVYRWDQQKLLNNSITSDWISELNRFYKGEFKFKEIQSDHLEIIISYLIGANSEKKKLKDCVIKLRVFEKQIRNIAAHEIAIITPEIVKSKTGLTCDDIVKMLKLICTNIGIDSKVWNTYDTMNEEIISRIG